MKKVKYPSILNSKVIGFDIETYDPFLKEKGPGVYRKDGYVLGISIANEKGFKEYYSLRHKDSNQDHQKNRNYLTEILKSNMSVVQIDINNSTEDQYHRPPP